MNERCELYEQAAPRGHPQNLNVPQGHSKVRFRIPRSLTHVQIIKHRQGKWVVDIKIRYLHGSQKWVSQVLEQLGYHQKNYPVG